MRLHNFFINQKIGDQKSISIEDKELIHQLKDVFRYEKGDKLILLDNSGFQYEANIEILSKEEGQFSIINIQENSVKPSREIYLYASMIKKDHFEWILEKGTELGVSRFIPIISERSIKVNFNSERGLKIIKEASEQSGRGILPELHGIQSLDESLEQLTAGAIAFHLDGKSFKENKNTIVSQNPLAVFIGPEGGWTDAEIEKFKAKGVEIYSLGEQTLRAETAAIAVASLLLL